MPECFQLPRGRKLRQHVIFQAARFGKMYLLAQYVHSYIRPVLEKRLFCEASDQLAFHIDNSELAAEAAYNRCICPAAYQSVKRHVVQIIRINCNEFIAIYMIERLFYRTGSPERLL